MTPKERLDLLVELAMEAWDRTLGVRPDFEVAVRERLAQGVQVAVLEEAEALKNRESYARRMELIGLGGEVDRAVEDLGDEEGPEWGPQEQAKLEALSGIRASITQKIARSR